MDPVDRFYDILCIRWNAWLGYVAAEPLVMGVFAATMLILALTLINQRR